MNQAPARYLIRFDDFCPTMIWDKWKPFEELLAKFRVRPILAVVPDNQDPELVCDMPMADFWNEMQRLQGEGAVIAMHGYQHLCRARGRSLIPLHTESEFAGVPEGQQFLWLQAGLRILRNYELNPRLFVAPRHGFDRSTLRALYTVGIYHLSDGLMRQPARRGGVTWLPQQLWAPQERGAGLWTICIHPNTAGKADVDALERFLETHAEQFTYFEKECAALEPEPITIADSVYTSAFLTRYRARQAVRRLRRKPLLAQGASMLGSRNGAVR